MVQIDHTLVDVIVVDRVHRKPLQRPWLMLAIDVASRMVAGFYLTLEPPSALSVALAIQHVVQPKFDWLESLGIDADWPAEGLPETIHPVCRGGLRPTFRMLNGLLRPFCRK